MAQRWLNQLKPQDAFVRLKPSATGFYLFKVKYFVTRVVKSMPSANQPPERPSKITNSHQL